MIKLLVNETKWSSLLARTRALTLYICILFLLHPIDNTLVVQYQLVQGSLNYVYIIKKRKLEWRRTYYSYRDFRETGPIIQNRLPLIHSTS